MQDFHLPATYYDPPEPHEVALVLDDNEACCITPDNLVDAWTWDGETYGFVCPVCDEDREIVREVPEPDYEAMREAEWDRYADREPDDDW